MQKLDDAKCLLRAINSSISGYDPVLKEKATDILLKKAFGSLFEHTGRSHRSNVPSEPFLPAAGPPGPTFETFIGQWFPKIQSERTLLCAYYLQRVLGYKIVTGNQLNKKLKKHGLGATNVTVAVKENEKLRPPRMRRVGKSGKNNQYVITNAGIIYVEGELRGIEYRL
jgi:hypothetical protein